MITFEVARIVKGLLRMYLSNPSMLSRSLPSLRAYTIEVERLIRLTPDDLELRQQLFEGLIRVTSSIIRRWFYHNMSTEDDYQYADIEDIVSYAVLAAYKAVLDYDANKFRSTTYVGTCVNSKVFSRTQHMPHVAISIPEALNAAYLYLAKVHRESIPERRLSEVLRPRRQETRAWLDNSQPVLRKVVRLVRHDVSVIDLESPFGRSTNDKGIEALINRDARRKLIEVMLRGIVNATTSPMANVDVLVTLFIGRLLGMEYREAGVYAGTNTTRQRVHQQLQTISRKGFKAVRGYGWVKLVGFEPGLTDHQLSHAFVRLAPTLCPADDYAWLKQLQEDVINSLPKPRHAKAKRRRYSKSKAE